MIADKQLEFMKVAGFEKQQLGEISMQEFDLLNAISFKLPSGQVKTINTQLQDQECQMSV